MVHSGDALSLHGPPMRSAKAERERDLVQGIHLLFPPRIWDWNEGPPETRLPAVTHSSYSSHSGSSAEGDFI